MNDDHEMPRSKAELVARINVAWDELESSLADLSEEQLTGPRDDAGWTGKDHLSHLAAWERSMVVLLRDRQPRYVGLGIDQALSESDDEDAANARIQADQQHRSLAEVQAERRAVHEEMMSVLAALSEDDLMKPCSDYVDGASDDPVYGFVNGNTWGHYDLHRPWIMAIAGGAS